MGTPKTHRHAETLAVTHHDVGTLLSRCLQHSEGEKIACHAHQGVPLVRGITEAL